MEGRLRTLKDARTLVFKLLAFFIIIRPTFLTSFKCMAYKFNDEKSSDINN